MTFQSHTLRDSEKYIKAETQGITSGAQKNFLLKTCQKSAVNVSGHSHLSGCRKRLWMHPKGPRAFPSSPFLGTDSQISLQEPWQQQEEAVFWPHGSGTAPGAGRQAQGPGAEAAEAAGAKAA